MRTVDKKDKCVHFIKIDNTYFNTEYPMLDGRVKWCMENIPEERLWYYDYELHSRRVSPPWAPVYRWNLIFFFELEEDVMAFKLVWV